jgi:alkanesulfonate monooxygenase SsuD/methylene tetrahydromethanopterin reductase-like flavin-dependent oxidoreductase (luciferase family)
MRCGRCGAARAALGLAPYRLEPIAALRDHAGNSFGRTAMDVGIQMVFASYGWDDGISDAQVWDEEIRLARLADELGFDVLWSVEHHFYDYSFCPDNLQLMAYLAGVTSHADLGTAAVILPWHDPLRVAEQVAILDQVSGGRFRFGIGRGLSRREFAHFRGPVAMDESRERFDEAAPMIIGALRTGWMEGDGKFYKQPKTPIRPKPERSFDGRIYAVASSEDSVEAAARLKARMVMFADRPWPMRLPQIERHRNLFRQFHNEEAPPFLIADFCLCTPTNDGIDDLARRRMGSFVDSNLEHYELLTGHFSRIKGYDAYAKKAEMAKDAGRDGIVDGFLKAAVYGTPDRILRALEERRAAVGEFELCTSFRFGGTPYALAEQSMRLYAKEILPVVKSWDAAPKVRDAAK